MVTTIGSHPGLLQQYLAQTEAHIIEGESRVARQREIIAELERDGHDSTQARKLLVTFERTLSLAYARRDLLCREVPEAM